MNADGSDPVRLTDDPEHDYLPSWSPHGERITFTSWRSEPGDTERANHIYVMNAEGSDQHRLFSESPGTSAGVVSLSDGSFFVATRKLGEQGSDIFLVEPDGEIRARLTDDAASNGAPALSPDGSRIAFYAETEAGAELVLVNLDGSGRRSLPTGRRSWARAGRPAGSGSSTPRRSRAATMAIWTFSRSRSKAAIRWCWQQARHGNRRAVGARSPAPPAAGEIGSLLGSARRRRRLGPGLSGWPESVPWPACYS